MNRDIPPLTFIDAAPPLFLAQGMRGWEDVMTIYDEMNTMAKQQEESFPNYVVRRVEIINPRPTLATTDHKRPASYAGWLV